MSASLEKLVFLVNSSNLGCCHRGVWEWRYSVMRPYSGSVTLNSSKDKTMLAPSGQYLKKYLCESTVLSCFHVDFITALWLRPICSFFIWTNRAALDLWASSSHTYHRVKRVIVFSSLIWFCQVNLRISLLLWMSVPPTLLSITYSLTSLREVSPYHPWCQPPLLTHGEKFWAG